MHVALAAALHFVLLFAAVGFELRPASIFRRQTCSSKQMRSQTIQWSMPRDMYSSSDMPSYSGDEITLSEQYRLAMHAKNRHLELEKKLEREPSIAEVASSLGITDEQLRIILINGETAKRKLMQTNMRLVLHMAGKYKHAGMGFPDLVQEGVFGLVKAIARYDGSKGFRFSTYASWWIKQAIARALAEKSRLVRLPVHIHDIMVAASRTEKQFVSAYGRKPTVEEITKRMGLPHQKVAKLLDASVDVMSGDDVHVAGKDGKDIMVHELIRTDEGDPTTGFDDKFTGNDLYRFFQEVLSDKEADVMALRFGLLDMPAMTLEEIGERFNVTRERIRQIETRALTKLRKPRNQERIAEMLHDQEGATLLANRKVS